MVGFRRFVGPLLSLVVACGGGDDYEQCAGGSPEATALDEQEQRFVDLLNAYRGDNDRGPLTPCRALNRAAQGHSEDMRDRDYFDHASPSGDSAWDRTCDACYEHGCEVYSAEMAENIAAGNGNAAATLAQWQASSGHNRNMLDSTSTLIGVGRAVGGGSYGSYWTTVFSNEDEPSCD